MTHVLRYENRLITEGRPIVREVEVFGETGDIRRDGKVTFHGHRCDQEIGGTGTFLVSEDGTVEHCSNDRVYEVGQNGEIVPQ